MKKIADNLSDVLDHLRNELDTKSNIKDTWLITLSLNQSKINLSFLKEEVEKLGFKYELNQHMKNHVVVRLWKNASNSMINEMVVHTLVEI